MSKSTETDVAFIKALADLLNESDLTELEVDRTYGTDDGMVVRLSRGSTAPAPVYAAPPASPSPIMAAAPVEAAREGTSSSNVDLEGAVTSPMVGTAYLAPEPDAPPFVKAGDQVAEGDTLLIIEAMKTMNQIPAPRSGTVKQVLVANGEPVEYGAPLVVLV
ncbi:MAG: acetyl-CoA carboxylase biotin carboxyl carrier protein [Pseudomonadota bacterium]